MKHLSFLTIAHNAANEENLALFEDKEFTLLINNAVEIGFLCLESDIESLALGYLGAFDASLFRHISREKNRIFITLDATTEEILEALREKPLLTTCQSPRLISATPSATGLIVPFNDSRKSLNSAFLAESCEAFYSEIARDSALFGVGILWDSIDSAKLQNLAQDSTDSTIFTQDSTKFIESVESYAKDSIMFNNSIDFATDSTRDSATHIIDSTIQSPESHAQNFADFTTVSTKDTQDSTIFSYDFVQKPAKIPIDSAHIFIADTTPQTALYKALGKAKSRNLGLFDSIVLLSFLPDLPTLQRLISNAVTFLVIPHTPSFHTLKIAQKFGLTLIAYNHAKFTIFTHSARVVP